MHLDEYRNPKHLEQLRFAEAVSNPESVYARLQKLEGSAYSSEVTKLEAERSNLKRQVSDAHRTIKELKQQNATLKNEREIARERLEALRESRTMQVGQTVTKPVKIARKFAKSPKSTSVTAARKFNRQWSKLRSSINAQKKGTKIQGATATPQEHAGPVELFNRKPNAENFEKALNHLWFVCGEIDRTKSLIESNPSFVDSLSEVPKSLASRVLGESRIQHRKLLLGRSESPAYVAEPQRVMYCVHQSPVFNSNGYSTRTRGVVNGLRAAGSDVVVVARSGYPWDSKSDTAKPSLERSETVLDGAKYVHIPGGNLDREPIDHYVMQAADAFVREARIIRPSVIQAASNFRTALPALIAARRLGIPFVYEVRGLWEFTEASAKPGFENTERFASMRQLETLVATNADKVLAITPQVKDELINRGVSSQLITVAPNSVDPEVFVPIPKDKHYAVSKKISVDVPVIGFAGSLVDYEGLDILLEASSTLHQKGIEHQLVFAGSGAAEKGLKNLVKHLNLSESTIFLGRLPQNQMPRLQSTFDIVVCPRKSNLVTELVSPLKPLESFSAGKATVLSDVSPNRDLAGIDQERALLCEADNAESLAQKLEKLIVDPELLADLGRTSRLWAVRERAWEKLGKLILETHYEAVENYRENTPPTVQLSSLRVGVIGDEFTRSTLEDAFKVELLKRSTWRDQLSSEPKLDMVFVESAWEGNAGDWHRGVGYYSDEESADLRELLEVAQEKGIPTVFWNKEDPVHFARFEPNAALFNHVFTTDANMIPRYLNVDGCRNLTVSALPFYVQPKLHNPLPVEREFKHSIAYAGSYYGDRYKERSEGLERLLEASNKYDMDIYDRQASNPDSPYKFPEAYRHAVRGGLPYSEVVESYKSHVAHLNVNSVLNSPTMFSRRVVEIPACGGIVLSAYGRGISETLGSNIANSNEMKDYRAWLHDWMTSPVGRLNEIWRQMRTVYRSHTTDSALAIVARTAGVPVQGMEPLKYAAHLQLDIDLSQEQRLEKIEALASQSIRPELVFLDELTKEEVKFANSRGLKIGTSLNGVGKFEVFFPSDFSRTFAEDVLLPVRFGEFSRIYTKPTELFGFEEPIVSPLNAEESENLTLAVIRVGDDSDRSLFLTLPGNELETKTEQSTEKDAAQLAGKTVLVAGHDLKFADAILDELSAAGCNVLIDKWDGHTEHNPEKSEELLEKADIVFCEWGLGNAVWYSERVRAHQSLIVRVHSQELFRPYLQRVSKANVDKFIFVGELIRKAAIASHGVPASKAEVIPNFVNIEALSKSKTQEAKKTLGIVGIVPKSKRLDRALDILEGLLLQDSEYKLRVKGKTPEDYPWMKDRPDEMKYYSDQYKRIDAINSKYPGAVRFDGYGADMHEWYSNIGIVISVSEFESFHLTIADGAASSAVPALLNWPGADLIYPETWLSGTTAEMVRSILDGDISAQEAHDFVEMNFRKEDLLQEFVQLLEVSTLHSSNE